MNAAFIDASGDASMRGTPEIQDHATACAGQRAFDIRPARQRNRMERHVPRSPILARIRAVLWECNDLHEIRFQRIKNAYIRGITSSLSCIEKLSRSLKSFQTRLVLRARRPKEKPRRQYHEETAYDCGPGCPGRDSRSCADARSGPGAGTRRDSANPYDAGSAAAALGQSRQ